MRTRKNLTVKILLHLWTSFAFVSFVVAFLFILGGVKWNWDDAYLIGGISSLFLLVPVFFRDLCFFYFKKIKDYYIYFLFNIVSSLSFLFLGWYQSDSEGAGYLYAFGFFLLIAGIPHFLFIKYLMERKLMIYIVSTFGFIYIFMYGFILFQGA